MSAQTSCAPLQGRLFCGVEYWYACPLQSISNLMQHDAVPLSCWNQFLRKTHSIYSLLTSVLSGFSIFQLLHFTWTLLTLGQLKVDT